MPPSPPNSIDLEDKMDENWHFQFEDSFFYEPYQMPEECLPPLPPLVSINEIPPRIPLRRQRKILSLTTTEDLLSPFGRTSPPSIPKHRKRTGSAASRGSSVASGRRYRLDHHKGLLSITTTITTPPTISTLLSPPGTPLSLIQSTTIPIETIREEKFSSIQQSTSNTSISSRMPPISSTSNVTIPGTVPSSSFSSLDESIESTVRKSRKQPGHGPISRYISKNTGQLPQKWEERLPSDPSRTIFRLVCPEWRTNPNLVNLPAGLEEHDYEGPIWSANEDVRLMKALTSKHGMNTYTTPTTISPSTFQPNWDFVAQYVNICSSHYRSPRQCALRYQNQVLHCDESSTSSSDRASTSTTSSSSSRKRQTNVQLNSIIIDNNFCNIDTTNLVRKQAGLITEITKHQNRLKLPEKQKHSSQILCLTGRLPQHQEQRLIELGARYTNVVRPMDVLDVRFVKRQQNTTTTNVGNVLTENNT
uniref:Myb-like domain-containing protein n=1 Tax=Meloidogyne hapla TaxID=6305 RepID=A0A1I8B0V7_MELHA